MGEARLTLTDHTSGWPKWLKSNLGSSKSLSQSLIYKPILVSMEDANAASKLKKLVLNNLIVEIIDVYDEQFAELFISDNAQLYKANLTVKRNSIQEVLLNKYQEKQPWELGVWVYYPWNGKLVHVLEEELLWKLKTIRNSHLIDDKEQERYRNFTVGCAGLSVGSNGAAAISITGGSQKIKLADGAVFSGSNLNRVRTGIDKIGINKALVIGRELVEANPFQEVTVMTKGLTDQNIGTFFDKPWPIDLVVDEIDDLRMKVILRMEARKRGIPVIMVTEPGDSLILDIERYDNNPNLQLFHGLVPGIEDLLHQKEINQRQKIKFMMKIIGVNNLPLRDQQAMLKVGSELPSPPQIGSTAMAAGGIIGFTVRQIATGMPIKSGRHIFSMHDFFMEDWHKHQQRKAHKKHTKSLKKIIKSL